MKVYSTDHPHSRIVCAAFAQGCKGQIVPPLRLLDGPAAVYGCLRGCSEIVRAARWVGRPFYYIDLGYFKRGHYDGYYRVTRNALQNTAYDDRAGRERFAALKIDLKPWKKDGKHVVVVPPSVVFADNHPFERLHVGLWVETVVSEVQANTNRPIITIPKKTDSENDLRAALRDAWIVVTYNSNVAVDALAEGIPVVTLGESSCVGISTALADIDNPEYGDRETLFRHLANNQWTLDEMRSGLCWEMLHYDNR